jgi:conjugal transfer pilus assembly protein TraI
VAPTAGAPEGAEVIAPSGDLFDYPPFDPPAPETSSQPATESDPPDEADDPSPDPAGPVFRLVAPLRLNPMVRDALAAAIATMNGDARSAEAITIATGVFVPIDHFKRRHIDLPVALRSLAETGMAVGGSNSRAGTIRHEMGGQQELGVVIRPDFVEGLDPADFAPSH